MDAGVFRGPSRGLGEPQREALDRLLGLYLAVSTVSRGRLAKQGGVGRFHPISQGTGPTLTVSTRPTAQLLQDLRKWAVSQGLEFRRGLGNMGNLHDPDRMNRSKAPKLPRLSRPSARGVHAVSFNDRSGWMRNLGVNSSS